MKAPRMYQRHEVNGVMVKVTNVQHDDIGPEIPGTELHLDPDTNMRTLFDAAGYVTYDTALPQPWVDEWNRCRYGSYTVPKGVWCYDKDRGCGIFGKFVPMETALAELGQVLLRETMEVVV